MEYLERALAAREQEATVASDSAVTAKAAGASQPRDESEKPFGKFRRLEKMQCNRVDSVHWLLSLVVSRMEGLSK